jgi:hypothetical protein
MYIIVKTTGRSSSLLSIKNHLWGQVGSKTMTLGLAKAVLKEDFESECSAVGCSSSYYEEGNEDDNGGFNDETGTAWLDSGEEMIDWSIQSIDSPMDTVCVETQAGTLTAYVCRETEIPVAGIRITPKDAAEIDVAKVEPGCSENGAYSSRDVILYDYTDVTSNNWTKKNIIEDPVDALTKALEKPETLAETIA